MQKILSGTIEHSGKKKYKRKKKKKLKKLEKKEAKVKKIYITVK